MRADSETLLFSVDLEDNRQQAPNPEVTPDRVVPATEKLIALLDTHGVHTTFFVVGACARVHAPLIRRLAEAGHELACHSDAHIPLDRHSQKSFRESVLRNIDALTSAGAPEPRGFRAPQLSLIAETRWAWEVLESLGFTYSSSVLPAKNPLYGYPGFGMQPRQVAKSLWEIPITVGQKPFAFPFASGIYFRLLPMPALRLLHARAKQPLVCYVHPYDADPDQRVFQMTPKKVWNALLFVRRSQTLPRLDWLMKKRSQVQPYIDYVSSLNRRV
jgi:hypothetical protein